MAKKSKEQKLIDEMLQCLWDASDINQEHIDDSNYRKFYEDAADELEYYEEDEEGEGDIYRFTYEALDEYVSLRNELSALLRSNGKTKEEIQSFIKEETSWED